MTIGPPFTSGCPENLEGRGGPVPAKELTSRSIHVMVGCATKHGATSEIAERIGQVLREAGLSADVVAVESVTDLAPYQAFVLGSAVYVGQWQKEAASFLEQFEEQLAQRPVWLFSSGPTGKGDPAQLMKGWRFPRALQAPAHRIPPGG